MKRLKKILAMMTILAMFPTAQIAFAAYTVTCTNCSEKLVQLLDRITNVDQLSTTLKQYQEDVQQTQQQIQMLQNMIKNTTQLDPSLRSGLHDQLLELARLTSQLRTQRGDITSLGQIFNTLFPEQELFGEMAGASPEEVAEANRKYQEHWDSWSASVDQAAQATFQLSGYQLDEMQKNPEQFQQYLNNLLNSPDGQMKAMQAGNQLAAIQVQEARQLRELMATSMQSSLASQMKREKESQMGEEQWRDVMDIPEEALGITGRGAKPLP